MKVESAAFAEGEMIPTPANAIKPHLLGSAELVE